MAPAPAASPASAWLDIPALGADLFDPVALSVVLIGTALATIARVGAKDMALAIRSGLAVTRTGFDADTNRMAIARWARAIRKSGLLGADEAMPSDADLARAITALVRTGSIKALRAAHEDACARHLRYRGRAVRVFEQAGDLAPVFGLVGTLFSMTQLAPAIGADANAITLGAIATAVLSSIYGVLVAHFFCFPMAQAVARQSQREEQAREKLVEWLIVEIADSVPGGAPARLTPLSQVA